MSPISPPLAGHSPPDLELFKTWLLDHQVHVHPSITLQNDKISGWGVIASRNIARGEILCGVPRSLVFSARTASLDTAAWNEPETAADLILRLTACLLHELRLGSESRWFGWLQFVPRDVIRVPTLWANLEIGGEDGQRGLEWLEGTEAGLELRKKDQEGLSLADLESYHANLELPPTPLHPEPSTLSSFLYAYSLVSSRGFALDSYHSIGLIPFCDMFNHSSSSPHTSLSVDSCVCETCGSLLSCAHDTDSDRLAHLSKEYLDRLEKEGMADKVDMRAQVDITLLEETAGKQVFSCYDEEINNAKLLVDYGFTEEGNTSISWSFREIMDGGTIRSFMGLLQSSSSPAADSQEDGRGRLVGLRREEQPEPLVLRSNGEISRNLFIALYLQITDKAELGEMEEEVQSALDAIEKPFTTHSSSSIISRTASVLVGLLEARVAGLHKSELSLNEIERMRDGLPTDSLERLGIETAMAERKLLEGTIARWKDAAQA